MSTHRQIYRDLEFALKNILHRYFFESKVSDLEKSETILLLKTYIEGTGRGLLAIDKEHDRLCHPGFNAENLRHNETAINKEICQAIYAVKLSWKGISEPENQHFLMVSIKLILLEFLQEKKERLPDTVQNIAFDDLFIQSVLNYHLYALTNGRSAWIKQTEGDFELVFYSAYPPLAELTHKHIQMLADAHHNTVSFDYYNNVQQNYATPNYHSNFKGYGCAKEMHKELYAAVDALQAPFATNPLVIALYDAQVNSELLQRRKALPVIQALLRSGCEVLIEKEDRLIIKGVSREKIAKTLIHPGEIKENLSLLSRNPFNWQYHFPCQYSAKMNHIELGFFKRNLAKTSINFDATEIKSNNFTLFNPSKEFGPFYFYVVNVVITEPIHYEQLKLLTPAGYSEKVKCVVHDVLKDHLFLSHASYIVPSHTIIFQLNENDNCELLQQVFVNKGFEVLNLTDSELTFSTKKFIDELFHEPPPPEPQYELPTNQISTGNALKLATKIGSIPSFKGLKPQLFKLLRDEVRAARDTLWNEQEITNFVTECERFVEGKIISPEIARDCIKHCSDKRLTASQPEMIVDLDGEFEGMRFT